MTQFAWANSSCVAIFDGLPLNLNNVGLDVFQTGNDYDLRGCEEDPCGCFNTQDKVTKSLYKDFKKNIKDASSRINEEYRVKAGKVFNEKLKHITQRMLYLDQLHAVGIVPKGYLNKIANCGSGGLSAKIKSKIPESCNEKLKFGFENYLNYKDVQSIDDFLTKFDGDIQNIANYKKHRKDSCLPYREFLNIESVNHHIDESGFEDFFQTRLFIPDDGLVVDNDDLDEDYTQRTSRQARNYISRDNLTNLTGYKYYTKAVKYKSLSLNPFLSTVRGDDLLLTKIGDEYKKLSLPHYNCVSEAERNGTDPSICKKPIGLSDFIYQNEEIMEEVFAELNNDCEALLGGEVLSNILCEENPDIPFDELSKLKSFKNLNEISSSSNDTKNGIMQIFYSATNQCDMKGTFSRYLKRNKPYSSPTKKMSVIEISDAEDVEDIGDVKKPNPMQKYEAQTSYEQMDQLACEIFPNCQGENPDPNCSKPEYMFYEVAKKFTKEFTPIGRDLLVKGKAPISSICDQGKEAELGFSKKINPEKIVNYCKLYRYFDNSFNNIDGQRDSRLFNTREQRDSNGFITQFNRLSRERAGLQACNASMFEGGCSASTDPNASSTTTTAPSNLSVTNTFWGNSGENTGDDGTSVFTNYLTRSSEDDYRTVVSSNGDISNPVYTQRTSYNGDRVTNSANSFTSNNDTGLNNSTINTPINQISSPTSRTSTSTVVRDSGRNNINSNSNNDLPSNNFTPITSTIQPRVNPTTPKREVASVSNYEPTSSGAVEEKFEPEDNIKEKVESNGFDYNAWNSKRRDEFEKKRKGYLDEIARIQDDIDRTRDSNERMRSEIAMAEAQKRLKDHDSQRSVLNKTPFSKTESRFSNKPSTVDQISQNTEDKNLNERIPASEKGKAVINGRQVSVTPEQAERLAVISKNLAKNGIDKGSRAAIAIEAIEGELAIKGFDSILFDENGKRRKLLPSDFVIPQGFESSIVAYREVGEKEIGVMKYNPTSKTINVMVYRHKNPKDFIPMDRSDKLPLDMRVAFNERNNNFEKIDTIASEYYVSRLLTIPFPHGEDHVTEVGYKLDELWEKTTKGYKVD